MAENKIEICSNYILYYISETWQPAVRYPNSALLLLSCFSSHRFRLNGSTAFPTWIVHETSYQSQVSLSFTFAHSFIRRLCFFRNARYILLIRNHLQQTSNSILSSINSSVLILCCWAQLYRCVLYYVVYVTLWRSSSSFSMFVRWLVGLFIIICDSSRCRRSK